MNASIDLMNATEFLGGCKVRNIVVAGYA